MFGCRAAAGILRLSPAGEGQGERKNQRNDGSGLSHGISGRVGGGVAEDASYKGSGRV